MPSTKSECEAEVLKISEDWEWAGWCGEPSLSGWVVGRGELSWVEPPNNRGRTQAPIGIPGKLEGEDVLAGVVGVERGDEDVGEEDED